MRVRNRRDHRILRDDKCFQMTRACSKKEGVLKYGIIVQIVALIQSRPTMYQTRYCVNM